MVLDASKKHGRPNAPLYEKAGVRVVYQGGEAHDLTGLSFCAPANYAANLGAEATRVVSCNTTALGVTIAPIAVKFGGVLNVYVVLIRRACDIGDSGAGAVNAIVPALGGNSHHAPDLLSVLPIRGSVISRAVKVPTDLMHAHVVRLTLPDGHDLTRERLLELWRAQPRVMVRNGKATGLVSTTEIRELGRRSPGREFFHVFIWEDSVTLEGQELIYMMAVPQDRVTVPPTIDAVRALLNMEADWRQSCAITDEALGIRTVRP